MELRFTKMQGLGNDFMVVDAIHQTFLPDEALIRSLADRHFGIGFDQLLLVERPQSPDTEFYYRIFNADGGEVEQCGNGARCFARFVLNESLTDNRVIDVGTAAGKIQLRVETDNQVTVNMGVPVFDPARIPFDAPKRSNSYMLALADRSLNIGALSMGNPHAIIQVDDVDTAPVEQIGPQVESHPAFPRHVNVGFMHVVSPERIDLRVYERGAGETLACGTGACAAVVYGRLLGLLHEQVEVSLKGGRLRIRWPGEQQPVWMTGPAETVFAGVIQL